MVVSLCFKILSDDTVVGDVLTLNESCVIYPVFVSAEAEKQKRMKIKLK